MNTYEITIHNYIPGRVAGVSEYYTSTFTANSEREAEKQAIKAFTDAMPFRIAGEVVEVYSVNGAIRDREGQPNV